MLKTSFTWSQVLAFRLARHHLAADKSAGLLTVCRDICGFQAQVPAAAQLAAWSRLPALTTADINRALYEHRTLIRTSCMRQTLHLIPAQDFWLYLNAVRQSRVKALLRIAALFGVTQRHLAALNESFLDALSAGPMPRRALLERIQPQVGKELRAWMKHVWGIQVFRLALIEGLICYGPDEGAESSFVRVDQWLPPQPQYAPDEALQELLRRYLRAYGPATLRDFAKWTGNEAREIKTAWAALQAELHEVSIEGQPAWLLRSDLPTLRNRVRAAQNLGLLPAFDPWLLGHADKQAIVGQAHYKRIYRSAGWISPVVLLNGRVTGIWSHKRQSNKLLVEVESFEPFGRALKREVEAEAQRLSVFFGLPAQVIYTG